MVGSAGGALPNKGAAGETAGANPADVVGVTIALNGAALDVGVLGVIELDAATDAVSGTVDSDETGLVGVVGTTASLVGGVAGAGVLGGVVAAGVTLDIFLGVSNTLAVVVTVVLPKMLGTLDAPPNTLEELTEETVDAMDSVELDAVATTVEAELEEEDEVPELLAALRKLKPDVVLGAPPNSEVDDPKPKDTAGGAVDVVVKGLLSAG